jgi:hypothetical protein
MKIVLTVLFILVIPILGWSFANMAVQLDFGNTLVLGFFGGGAAAAVIHVIRTRYKSSYFATFEHELTHNLWAILTLNKPAGFHINDDGTGEFEYYGKSNFLQMLGPYVTLTLSFLLIPAYYVIKEEFHFYYFILLGLSVGYHTASTIKETGFFQTDIQRQGRFFSVIFIIFGNLFSYGIVLSFLINRHQGMLDFLTDGFLQVWDLAQTYLPI